MTRRRSFEGKVAALVAAGLGLAAIRLTAAESSAPKVTVGPNILVSRDGDVPHVEYIVATSPRTVKNLVGAAITATRPTGGWACRTYSSTDGGASWKASEFPEQVKWGGGDPQTAFTIQGTALFVALTMNQSDAGRDCASMHVWRSENGGDTWLPPAEIPCNPSWDHEQIIVDTTKGRHAGRIYLGALYDYPVYRIGVFRSDDDGRTWIGPSEAANGGGTKGINDVTPMVLSDGTLVVPYGDFDFLPEKRKSTGMNVSNFFTVSSTDGGVTFGAPQKSVSQTWNLDDKETALAGFAKFAADVDGPKYRDRIYAVWEDARLGKYKILFAYSADRGKTWSAPKPIDASAPASASQWQPAVAVNKDGVVALTWFDGRDPADPKAYDQYIAVSVDGGETIQSPVRVSSATSHSDGPGNSQLSPMVWKHEGEISLSLISAGSRWASGGDYMGLAADKSGTFHPFWADARSGTFQIYTAAVKVEMPKPAPAGAPAPPAPKKPELVETPLNDLVEFVFDPTRLDTAKKEIEIPIRVKNASTQTIYAPIRLEILGFGFPQYENEEGKKRDAENAPTVLNSSNDKTKEGAVFELGESIAGSGALPPGGLTNPFVIRLRLVDAKRTPTIRLKASGMVSTGPVKADREPAGKGRKSPIDRDEEKETD